MKRIKQTDVCKYKPGTKSILKAALDKNIAVYTLIENERVFILKKNKKVVWLRGPRLSISNPVSLWIIKDKYLTKKVLSELKIPFPEGLPAKTLPEALKIAKKIGFPLVIKPRSFEGGKGVFLNVTSLKKVKEFFPKSLQYDNNVLLEKEVFGTYYRITMVDYAIAGILETKGISLMGNGKNTVIELILELNVKKKRGALYKITKKTNDILSFQNLSLDSIPKAKRAFILGFSGAEGGDWIDRTDEVCKENKKLLSNLTRYLDLRVVGIDLIATNISRPITAKKTPGYILEINGAPEFIFHLNPTKGRPRDIGEKIIKMLFR